MHVVVPDRTEEELTAIFELWDDDKNGSIGLKEFSRALAKEQRRNGVEVKSAKEMQKMVRAHLSAASARASHRLAPDAYVVPPRAAHGR
jgi:Ca2+-binding EF-hand superfamily protein